MGSTSVPIATSHYSVGRSRVVRAGAAAEHSAVALADLLSRDVLFLL